MKVLVTGASGFIGGYLVHELLEHGYDVRAMTRKSDLKVKGAEVVVGDIAKLETLLPVLEGVEAVFHNAAYALDWGKKKEFYRVNVLGTRNLAEACKQKRINRIVYTSSAGVYGFPNTTDELIEDSPKKPFNTYQKSKLEAENVLRRYKDLHISIVRPPLVLGAGAKATTILLSQIENKKMAYIGVGNQYISLVHPQDVTQCLRLAFEKDGKGDTYNVVSFICTIKELFEEISTRLHVDPPQRHIPYLLAYNVAFFTELFAQKDPSLTRFRVKSLGTTRRISCEKASSTLGYKPQYDLKSTVEDMVSWYEKTRS
jgi:nucleoside-diphosphate-sugar epimerase